MEPNPLLVHFQNMLGQAKGTPSLNGQASPGPDWSSMAMGGGKQMGERGPQLIDPSLYSQDIIAPAGAGAGKAWPRMPIPFPADSAPSSAKPGYSPGYNPDVGVAKGGMPMPTQISRASQGMLDADQQQQSALVQALMQRMGQGQ